MKLGLLTTFLILVLLLILCSCGANFHLKRAKYHELKAEAKGAKINHDTTFITKEVIVPQIQIDTVLKEVNFRDTLVVNKDNVITKIKINDVLRTVYVKTICPPDSILVKVPVTITKEISAGYGWFDVLKWCILVAVVSVLLGKLIWK